MSVGAAICNCSSYDVISLYFVIYSCSPPYFLTDEFLMAGTPVEKVEFLVACNC